MSCNRSALGISHYSSLVIVIVLEHRLSSRFSFLYSLILAAIMKLFFVIKMHLSGVTCSSSAYGCDVTHGSGDD